MTTTQVSALQTGLLVFFTLWAVVLVPQLVLHAARFGRIVLPRVAVTAALLCYACLALAVVMLPLPGPRTAHLSQGVQLVPFQWIADMQREADGGSLLQVVTTPAFEQMALNVVLFVPLGIFARLMWRRGFAGTVVLGFAVSLLIELTQLTANWGTALFQYRIFDVDDLGTNTTGAALGWIAGALFLMLRGSARVGSEAVRERVDLAKTR